VVDRLHEPAHEIVTLTDYRTRYAQYRRDPNLQALHAAHPMIAIWDDHEIANNSYETGAQNHQPNEGSYAERRAAAMQAYREWMPIRPASEKGYRAVKFGAMVDLLMIETRLDGRTEAVSKEAERHRPADRHHMMGVEQADWLREQLTHSSATYRVLGNQVIFTELNLGILPSDRLDRYNLDAWDGYASERDALTAEFAQVAPVVILTGDSHCSWAFEGTGYVELCAPSVTSTNFNEFALEVVSLDINVDIDVYFDVYIDVHIDIDFFLVDGIVSHGVLRSGPPRAAGVIRAADDRHSRGGNWCLSGQSPRKVTNDT